jgi:hypothetical protein
MIIRRFKRLSLAWIAILLYGLLTFADVTGWVLCHEPDGKVALEISINGQCSDSWQAQEESHPGVSVSPEQRSTFACQRCIDIPINLISAKPGLMQIHPVHSLSHPALALLATGFQAYSRLNTLTLVLFPNPPPSKPFIHKQLEAIILII